MQLSCKQLTLMVVVVAVLLLLLLLLMMMMMMMMMIRNQFRLSLIVHVVHRQVLNFGSTALGVPVRLCNVAVSYTHLTLPTIYSV